MVLIGQGDGMLTGKAFTKTTGGGIGTSHYYAGGKRVAMRVRNADFSTNLYYLLSDHLGSTSVTADSQGNALPLWTEIVRTAITVALSVIIVFVWGSKTMTLKPTADSDWNLGNTLEEYPDTVVK